MRRIVTISAGKRTNEHIHQPKEPQPHLLGFGIRQGFVEFLLINLFEGFDGLLAELHRA